jgi:hypothetical protein
VDLLFSVVAGLAVMEDFLCVSQGAGGIGLTMIKLFSVKQKQKEAAESANGRVPIKKQSAGELRLQKGLLSSLFSCMHFLTMVVAIAGL